MKNSIKREQSQACLNFAERKNFRLQAKHKILMTLALLLTAATGAWAQTETLLTTITPTGKGSYSETTAGVVTVTLSNVRRYNGDFGWLWGGSGSVTVEAKEGYTITRCVFKQNAKTPVTITTSPFAITFDDRGDCVQNDDMDGVTSIEVYGPAAPAEPAIDVTTNAAEEGATFTEASFDMPTDDVTVNYELVRDMSVQMNTTMGDGTDGLRYRVKKDEQNPGKYEPADMNMLQVLTLVAVNDGIEQKDLTLNQDYYCRIYKLDEQTQQPDGDGVELADFDFAPGLYALKAFAMEGSNYDGETALSNTFKLFEGYELKIAAGEYVTYYKDEALYVEDTDAQLYTITSVNGDKANVVQVDVAKANMPILVKNNSADEKTILLIPTSEQTPDEVSAAEEFVGTLTATEIAASDATTERYAFNGKEFVWVKDAIAVGANRAWLEVPTSFAAGAHAIELVFDGETTRILSVENGELKIENYDYIYNLSGQRVSKDYKGVVVVNGKKVIRK